MELVNRLASHQGLDHLGRGREVIGMDDLGEGTGGQFLMRSIEHSRPSGIDRF
jgi:hypothetical protein